ncbi:hypothetical protein JTE90_003925 [Oedothorax gibbosus]|uniref:Uncharacterized protein n=1 Tax=Oedothorax gibbosus TaxID=931172 RepID=A0AAV6UWA9_9ARAC|nr:hypothetical protein JTE90_003925 [Oedothorax gibbosus]
MTKFHIVTNMSTDSHLCTRRLLNRPPLTANESSCSSSSSSHSNPGEKSPESGPEPGDKPTRRLADSPAIEQQPRKTIDPLLVPPRHPSPTTSALWIGRSAPDKNGFDTCLGRNDTSK